MSVTGPVQPCDLGVVLPHEHVFADLVREYRGTGLLNDEYLACRLLTDFLPLLIAAGLDEEEVRRYVTVNPRAALTGEPPP